MRVRKLIFNKKGFELSFQTIISLIICMIVLVLVIYFFREHYFSNSESLINIGEGAIFNN